MADVKWTGNEIAELAFLPGDVAALVSRCTADDDCGKHDVKLRAPWWSYEAVVDSRDAGKAHAEMMAAVIVEVRRG